MGKGTACLGGAIVMLAGVLALLRQGRDVGYRTPEPAAAPAERPPAPPKEEPAARTPETPPAPPAGKPPVEAPHAEMPSTKPSGAKPDEAPPALQDPPSQGGTGSVEGTVRLSGDPPVLAPLKVTTDKDKCGLGDSVPDESLVVNRGTKGVANAVVTLEPKEGKSPPTGSTEVLFDQKHCIFTEHVKIVPAGATVVFKNSDTVGHNVNVQAVKNPQFNEVIEGDKDRQRRFDKEEKIPVTCNIHPWMKGWLFVTDAPYAAKTDAKGSFKIENVPPGTYKVKVWHERLSKKESWKGPAEVVVKAGTSVRADFEGALR